MSGTKLNVIFIALVFCACVIRNVVAFSFQKNLLDSPVFATMDNNIYIINLKVINKYSSWGLNIENQIFAENKHLYIAISIRNNTKRLKL